MNAPLIGFFSPLATPLLPGWLLLLVGLGLSAPRGQAGSSSNPRLEGWQNRALKWGSGVQAGNSSYSEDRVVPVRWVGSLRAGSTHTLTLKFDFQRSGGGAFFDSLAGFDATEAGVPLDSGVTLEGVPSTWAIPTDATLPRGAQTPGSLTSYGIQRLEFGAYSTLNGVRCLPLRFTVAGTSGNRMVVLAAGLHLASELDWGVGRGALQSPGASGKAYASLNGTADLNVAVNPDALAPSADLALTLTGPGQAYVGDVVTYRLTVANQGPNSARETTVTNPLPRGTTWIGGSATVGSVSGSATGPITAALGDLLPGTSATVEVRLRLEEAAAGILVNAASTASSTPDPVAANNAASASTTVIIPDRTPPVVNCPPDLTQATDPQTCGARVEYAVTAWDETSSATLTVDPPSGSLFPVGTTPVTVTATDQTGNTSVRTFRVTVVDREGPTIPCPADLVVEAPRDGCEQPVPFLIPSATDACDGQVPVTSDIPSGAAFPIGQTVVTLSAQDQSGNRTTCSFTVTVKDPPNESWPAARVLGLVDDPAVPGVLSGMDRQCLTRPDQSRWYRLRVQPGSTLVVTLTELSANYDLVVFKDIAATYAGLVAETSLPLLNAAFAADAFSPAAFSADALSPAAFSPAAFSPAAFSPAAFSPAAFSPAAFSPAAFSPAAFSPDAYAPAAFSPAAFSPAAFSPAAFSPAAFSPAQFSPAAFSDAQAQSVIAVSAFDGTASEGVVVRTWDSTSDFYVRVRGRNGVYLPGASFQLQAYLFPGTCGDLQLEALDLSGAPLPAPGAPVAGDYRTLILADPGRMANDGALDRMNQRLAALANRPEVRGVVVDLGADPRVAFFQEQADRHPDCPTAKNLAAVAIQRVVRDWWAANPALQHVVLVGGDGAIPFFRYPDQALLGPERNYVPPVRDLSASQASLRWNYVLGQDGYGTRCDVPRAAARLPVPELGVGRLVENPAEIAGLVEAYLATPDGVVATPASALVTGYDFLTDAAEAVRDELAAGLGRPVDSLITPADLPPSAGWTADQLRQALFGSRHDLVFLAGHFSAFGALAADFTTHVRSEELLTAGTDFANSILISAGCHSGYNAVDGDGIAYVTPQPDWAQACARRQATLVAGTGYQYGDTDFIEYSERLYLEFVRQLRRGTGPVSLGQALLRAKRQYLATTPNLRGLHEKAYLQATLFGLPMLQVALPTGRTPAAPEVEASVIPASTPYTTAPGSVLGLTRADFQLDPTFSLPRTVELVDFESGGTATATYFEGRDGILNNPAEPILPLEIRNVSIPGTVLRGVGFRGGDYEDLGDLIPLTGAATTEIRGVHVGFPVEVFFPLQPWGVNPFGSLCSADGGPTRLAVASAQFRVGSAASVAGTLRRFHRMQFRLFYNHNLASYPDGGSSTPGRSGPPSITEVFATSEAGRVRFSTRVTGNPAAGIQEVWVTCTAVGGGLAGHWRSVDLVQNPGDSTLWEGELVLDGTTAAADIRYLVQAVNGVGLVALNTRQGRYHIPDFKDGREDANAQPTALSLLSPPTVATYGSRVTLTARLTANGQALEGYPVVFGLADQQATARTGTGAQAGVATATLTLATVPGTFEIKATYPGGFGMASSWAAAPIEVTPAPTRLQFDPANAVVSGDAPTSLTALLTDGNGSPISERSVLFLVEGAGPSGIRAVITDYAGRAPLGPLNLGSGVYAVTAHFASRVEILAGTPDATAVDLRDPRYLPGTGTASLTVDADAPVVTGLTATPSVLNTPNHKMVPVTVTLAAIDASGTPVSRIVAVSSNEPENGLGDGDQAPDWEITGDLSLNLRSERAQNGRGRTYTIFVEVRDPLGNARRDTVTVFVPK